MSSKSKTAGIKARSESKVENILEQRTSERTIEQILNDGSSRENKGQTNVHLYTGTSEEDLRRKEERSTDNFLEDWEDRRLWFTPRLHDHPKSDLYYAGQATTGGQCRYYEKADTPIMVLWSVQDTSRGLEIPKLCSFN